MENENEKVKVVKPYEKAHHMQCNDCGKFLPKRRWVAVDDPYKSHALCLSCLSDYE